MPEGLWPEELVKALWVLYTLSTRATGFSSFKLLLGDEAMTLGELTVKSLHAMGKHEPAEREVTLDLLEENRMQTITTMARYTVSVATSYNKKVRVCPLAPGNMVLKRVANSTTVG